MPRVDCCSGYSGQVEAADPSRTQGRGPPLRSVAAPYPGGIAEGFDGAVTATRKRWTGRAQRFSWIRPSHPIHSYRLWPDVAPSVAGTRQVGQSAWPPPRPVTFVSYGARRSTCKDVRISGAFELWGVGLASKNGVSRSYSSHRFGKGGCFGPDSRFRICLD
jgi:hypothetical protein